jgi:SAM-dependent methyltransferase
LSRPKTMEFLSISREKWREVPAGGDILGRSYSTDLLKLSDQELLSQWQRMNEAGSVPDHRGWYQVLYREAFAGRRIVEVGSGLGFDGIYFMKNGARWLFADIVKDNLEAVRRLVGLHGLSAQAEYLWIEDPMSLARLEGRFDVVWANGSLHHAPFEIAREESLLLLRRLKAGGRWIELFYPYDRWVRQGRLPFSEWGKVTDGERTPWAEWYDVERIKSRLFPAITTTILDFGFGGGQYGWADLRVDEAVDESLSSAGAEQLARAVSVIDAPLHSIHGTATRKTEGVVFRCSPRIWDYSCALDVREQAGELGASSAAGRRWAVDLEVQLSTGAIGIVLTGEDQNDFLGREIVVDARPTMQRLSLSTHDSTAPRWLLIRNTSHETASAGVVGSALLRIGA